MKRGTKRVRNAKMDIVPLLRRLEEVDRRAEAHMLFLLESMEITERRTALSIEREHTSSKRAPPLALELRDAFAAHGHQANTDEDLALLERVFDYALTITDANPTQAAAKFSEWCATLPHNSSAHDLLLVSTNSDTP